MKLPSSPLIMPEKVPGAVCVTVRVLRPKSITPEPDRFLTEEPPDVVVLMMLNTPITDKELELAIEPDPDRFKIPPLITVGPV